MSQIVKFDGLFSIGGKKVEFQSEANLSITADNLINFTGKVLSEAITKVVEGTEEEETEQQDVPTVESQENPEPICTCEDLDDDCDSKSECDECCDCEDDKPEQTPQVVVQKVPADKVGQLMKLLEEISNSAR